MTALLAKSAFSARCTLYSPLQTRTESDLQLWVSVLHWGRVGRSHFKTENNASSLRESPGPQCPREMCVVIEDSLSKGSTLFR